MTSPKHTFFAPSEAIAGDTVVLPADEAAHAVRVLRIRSGDEAAVVDGEGNWYRVACEVVGRKGLVGRILDSQKNVGEPEYDLTIGLGILKNPARFETFLEKAVELGVSGIIPLITRRTEKSRIKEGRMKVILRSAMKQSGRSRMVRLDPPTKLKKLRKDVRGDSGLVKLACHEQENISRMLGAVLHPVALRNRLLILVGPEGGFTDDEMGDLTEDGFLPTSLGPRRLRSETAAITASAGVMLAQIS